MIRGGASIAIMETGQRDLCLVLRTYLDNSSYCTLEDLNAHSRILYGSEDRAAFLSFLEKTYSEEPEVLKGIKEARRIFGLKEQEGPLYRYTCKECGEVFEMESPTDDPEETLWGHLQFEHPDLYEECQSWETPDMVSEFFEVAERSKEPMNVLKWEDARQDVASYLAEQGDAYFAERGRARKDVLEDNELIDTLTEEHMRCVNRFGNDREWSVRDACDHEPGFSSDRTDMRTVSTQYDNTTFVSELSLDEKIERAKIASKATEKRDTGSTHGDDNKDRGARIIDETRGLKRKDDSFER